MHRRDVLAFLAAAALPWSAKVTGRAGGASTRRSALPVEILFLAAKVPALIIGVVRNGQASVQGFGRRDEGSNAEPDGGTLFASARSPKSSPGRCWRASPPTAWSVSPTP